MIPRLRGPAHSAKGRFIFFSSSWRMFVENACVITSPQKCTPTPGMRLLLHIVKHWTLRPTQQVNYQPLCVTYQFRTSRKLTLSLMLTRRNNMEHIDIEPMGSYKKTRICIVEEAVLSRRRVQRHAASGAWQHPRKWEGC